MDVTDDGPRPPQSIASIFDPPRVPYGSEFDEEGECLIARERCGPRFARAVVSPLLGAGRCLECVVYAPFGDGWTLEAQEGVSWPLDPAAPRPAAAGFAHVTAPLPYDGGAGAHVLRAGVAGTAVATVEIATTPERHLVEVDPGSGAFLALAPLGADAAVELVARGADGSVLERVAATIGPDDWPRHGEWPPGPLPEWLRGPLDAAVGDFTRAGGAPPGLTLGYTPNGRGGVVWVTHDLPDRWGWGIDAFERGPALLQRLADELQECWHELPSVAGSALPPCPGHPHRASTTVRDGAAWWVCPADGRPLAPIGAYAR